MAFQLVSWDRNSVNTLIFDQSVHTAARSARRQKLAWNAVVGMSLFVKRAFDVVGSTLLIIFLSPLYLVTAASICIENPGTFIFTQKRVGKNGQLFSFYKFRSMVIGAENRKDELLNQNESRDGITFKIKNDPRVTRVGRFIRRFSIDELPQLFNVMKGDMSLVGPRPPVPREVAEYTLEDRKRLHVTPGITCIWQVSGRSEIPFKQQVVLDLQYIRNRGFLEDMHLLLRTVTAVLSGRGAY